MRLSLCGVELGMSKDEVRELLGPAQVEFDHLWRYLSPRRGEEANPLPDEVAFEQDQVVRVGPGRLLMRNAQTILGARSAPSEVARVLGPPDGYDAASGDAIYVRDALRIRHDGGQATYLLGRYEGTPATWEQHIAHRQGQQMVSSALGIARRVSSWLQEQQDQELAGLRDALLEACVRGGDVEGLTAKILEAYRKATGQDLP